MRALCYLLFGFVPLLAQSLHPAKPLSAPTLWMTETLARADSEKDCKWWQSPIIVGGTEGSGTRGAVDNVRKLGVAIFGVLPNCHGSGALDSDCIVPKTRPIPSPFSGPNEHPRMGWGVDAWTPSTRAMIHLQDWHKQATPKSLEELFTLTADPERTRQAMEGLVDEAKQPWRWAWKMPHTVALSRVSLSYLH